MNDNKRILIRELPPKFDREAYNHLFKEYYPHLLAYGELFLDTQAAEDIVQDVLVNIWKNSESLEIHTSLESYLFKSVYLRCLNQIKQQKVRKGFNQIVSNEFLELETQYFNPDQNDAIRKIFMEELKDEIDKAMNFLTAKCREAFSLSYIHDMKNKEIAVIMNISERTVETHIYNALKILRTKLKNNLFLFLLLSVSIWQ